MKMGVFIILIFGLMFISFVSATASFQSAGTIVSDTVGAVTVTPTCPAHVADDILVVYAGSDVANDMATATAGWATIATLGGSNNDGLWLWLRTINDSAPNPTITASDDDVFAICYVIRGTNTTGTPYEDATTAGDLNTVNVTTAEITTTDDDRFIVTFAGMEDDIAWSTSPPPTDWATESDLGTSAGTDWKFTVISKTEATAITVLETSVGIQAGTDGWNSLTLAFLPSGVDTTKPTYNQSQTNTTYAGNSTLFSVYWDDDTALHPNGQYIFSTNNSGQWVNDTAINFTTTPQWANVTKDLNDTVGISIGYRWYANDTVGNFNYTDIFELTTTQTTPPDTDFMETNLVHGYNFNETSGDVIDVRETRNGTALNDVGRGVDGLFGYSFEFGGDGNDSHVNLTNGFWDDIPANWSMTFWVNRTSTSTHDTILWVADAPYEQAAANPDYLWIFIGSNAFTDCENNIAIYRKDNGDWTAPSDAFQVCGNTTELGVGTHVVYITNDDGNLTIKVNNVTQNLFNKLVFTQGVVNTLFESPARRGVIGAQVNSVSETSYGSQFNGRIDQPYFFNKSLNDTEYETMYNSENLRLYEPIQPDLSAPIVSLNSPIDNFNSTSQTINFNCTVSDDIDLDNVTLMLNGTTNQTNTTGINNSAYLFSLTLDEGNYNWSCRGEDSDTNVTIATYRDFGIDSVDPTIVIDSPVAQNYTYGETVWLNYSGGEDTCWYSLNDGTNITLDSCQNITLGENSGDTLTFGVIADLHYDDGALALLTQTITRMNSEYEIDFVVMTGDGMTNSLSGCSGDQARFNTVNDVLNNSEGDSYYLPGNHEFDNCVEADWAGYPVVFNDSAEYGSFRIYIVNASQNNEDIPNYQLNDLYGFLQDGNYRTFVFGHHPAYGWIWNDTHYYFQEAEGGDKMYINNNETFMQYLENNTYNGDPKTLAYISAHLHMQNTSDSQYRNNVFYPSHTSMWEELDTGSPVVDQNETYVYEINNTHIKINVLGDNPETIIKEYNWTFPLDSGIHNVTVWSNDTFGNVGSDFVQFNVSQETTVPNIDFVPPTLDNGSETSNDWIFVNVSSNSSSTNISTVINFDNSLVSWWRMDDINGTNDVVDYFGNYNGSAEGNAVQTDNGYFGKGFEFDGDDDLVNFGDQAIYDFGTLNFTISFWTNTSHQGGQGLISKRPICNYDVFWHIQQSGAGNVRVEFDGALTGGGSSADYYDLSSTTQINDSNWHHVIVGRNGTTAFIYIDGVLEGTDSNTVISDISNAGDVHIGNSSCAQYDSTFNGTMDDVMIFNRSLAVDEVVGLYANTSTKYLENNFTGLSVGNHTFRAYVQDENGNVNFTEIRTVNITSGIVDTSFTVSLPIGYTQINFSNSSLNASNLGAEGQNITTGVLFITNTGDVGLDIYLIMNATESGFTLFADTDNETLGATVINAAPVLLKDNLASSSSQNIWMWLNWTGKTPQTIVRKLNTSVQEN